MKPELELKEVDINSIIDEIRKLKWESFDKDSPLKSVEYGTTAFKIIKKTSDGNNNCQQEKVVVFIKFDEASLIYYEDKRKFYKETHK